MDGDRTPDDGIRAEALREAQDQATAALLLWAARWVGAARAEDHGTAALLDAADQVEIRVLFTPAGDRAELVALDAAGNPQAVVRRAERDAVG